MFDGPISPGLDPDERLLERPAVLEWGGTPMIES
jgi:hypothetical protein